MACFAITSSLLRNTLSINRVAPLTLNSSGVDYVTLNESMSQHATLTESAISNVTLSTRVDCEYVAPAPVAGCWETEADDPWETELGPCWETEAA